MNDQEKFWALLSRQYPKVKNCNNCIHKNKLKSTDRYICSYESSANCLSHINFRFWNDFITKDWTDRWEWNYK